MLEIFNECSYSIWLHFGTKSKLISIRSQVLHHFVCWKCVEKVPFLKSGHIYIYTCIQYIGTAENLGTVRTVEGTFGTFK